MRKAAICGLAFVLALSFLSCASAKGPVYGAAAGEALIKMLPRTATGVLAVDVRRLMGTESVAKALQDPKAKAKYDEFVAMSGIDPMKDIFYAGVGLVGAVSGPSAEGGAVISLKYDQAKLKELIKAKAPEAKEEIYNGVTVYSNIDGDSKQTTRAAFLDAGHIVIGSENGVKGIIDVSKKSAESLAKNPEMAALLKKAGKANLVWGAFAVPQDLLKKGIESSPQLKVLEGVTGLVLGFDDRANGVVADIRTLGGTKEQNTNLAQALTGFKALGAMAGSQEPVVAEALNGISITSGDDYVDLSISLSREVMDKIGQLARSKAGQLMMPKKDGTL